MGTRIIVKNLPKHAKDKDVLALFSECGDITDCKVAKTKYVHKRTRNSMYDWCQRSAPSQGRPFPAVCVCWLPPAGAGSSSAQAL